VSYAGLTPPFDIRGLTYDHVNGKWLPVPRQWVMPDYTRYAYPAQDGSIHVVDLYTGADTSVPDSKALLGYLLAVEPDGIYGAPAPLDLVRVGWQGGTTVIEQGDYWNTFVVGEGVAYGSKDSGTVHDIDRIDVRTGSVQPWFRSISENLRVVGTDDHGNPLIVASDSRGGSLWLVTAPSTSDEPSGQPLGRFLQDPGTVTVVQGQGGFWIESTTAGLFHNDFAVANSSFGFVNSFTGFIAGPCV